MNDPKDPYCGGKLKRITELDNAAKKPQVPAKMFFGAKSARRFTLTTVHTL
jgi:hypothetical protein